MLRVEDAEFDLQDGADNAREYLGSFTSSQWSDLSNDEPGPIVMNAYMPLVQYLHLFSFFIFASLRLLAGTDVVGRCQKYVSTMACMY